MQRSVKVKNRVPCYKTGQLEKTDIAMNYDQIELNTNDTTIPCVGMLPAISSKEHFGNPIYFKPEGKRIKCVSLSSTVSDCLQIFPRSWQEVVSHTTQGYWPGKLENVADAAESS